MIKLTKEKRDRLIMVAVVTVLIIAGLWYLVIRGQGATLAANAKKFEELQKKISDAQRLAKQTDEVDQKFKEAQDRIGAIETSMMLPVGNEYTTMFTLLKDAVKAFPKVEFLGDLQKPTIGDTDLLPTFPYKSAAFDGTLFYAYYQDMGKFVAEMENTYPYTRFQVVSVRHLDTPRPDEPEKLRFELRIVALVQPTLAK